ncbi:hypothetical protein LL912_00715 [Niabella sp. CC-SYL272]|uniref:DUF6745 domain-containing protein n=1 Tax=Niabella agricola TaxID=2891571 RepID=UPI001F473B6A|nr:hypothetical protein [Niabella agricola]MCF3107288.1 hypothetical protein [Niabella agricola]
MKKEKLTTLTNDQEAQIPVIRDQWLNYILSCENRLDRDKAREGIEWLYSYCGKKRPVVIFMDSPFGCQVAANYFLKFFKDVPANIRGNIGDNIGANIRGNIWANIRGNIGDNIRGNIWANIRGNIWANIGANIRANIGDNIWANIGANKLEYHASSWYGNVGDYGWVAYMDYFFQMKMIHSDREDDFNTFKNLLLSGVYDMIQFEGLCIVSDMPTVILRNETGRLHSVDRPAIEFRDGTCYHYIHGVAISPDLWLKLSKKEYTFTDFMSERNEEVKSACLAFMDEKWGSEYLFRFISDHLKEVDTYVDKKDDVYLVGTTRGMNIGVYTLFKGELNDIRLAFVRCYCPSTDRMFFLCVDPSNSNAKDAIASLYRVPRKLQSEIKYIQRQGERYSTVFTEKGRGILKSLSNDDISDLTHLPGKQYFSLLKYEY